MEGDQMSVSSSGRRGRRPEGLSQALLPHAPAIRPKRNLSSSKGLQSCLGLPGACPTAMPSVRPPCCPLSIHHTHPASAI